MTPDRKPTRRPRRVLWSVAVLVALLAYPVLGTLFLWTGWFERLLGSEDLKVEIENPSWTLWPGHIHVASARVLVNGDTQFELDAKNLLLHVNLFSLIHHRVRLTTLSARDVRYFMRVQVKDPKGIEERLAAYPKLPDLPGNPTLIEGEAKQTEDRGQDFTVDVDGIDVDVSELWFMEYHYVGPGTLKGGFLVGPNRMRVDTSVQNLGPGELRFGADHVIAKNFGGRVEAQIPELDPEQHADTSFLELVTADIRLKGDVLGLSHVSAYTPGIRVLGGEGPFEAHVILTKGRLGDGSTATFSTRTVGIRGLGYGVDTDWDFKAHVSKAEPAEAEGLQSDAAVLPRAISKSQVTYVSLSDEHKDIFTTQLQEHDERVALSNNQLGKMTDIDHARIRFPKIVTSDLDDLGKLTSGGKTVQSAAGEAKASFGLDIDGKHVAEGGFEGKFTGLRISVADLHFRGTGDARFRVHSDLNAKVTTIRKLSVDLTDVGMQANDQTMTGWWTRLEVPTFTAWGLPPERFSGNLSVRSKSAEPILKALVAKDRIPGLVSDLTSLPDLTVRGTFRKSKTITDVMLEPLENDVFDVAGRYYAKGEDSRLAIVVGGKALSLGIAKDRTGTSLMPFAREGWLNEKLDAFPEPARKIRSSQP